MLTVVDPGLQIRDGGAGGHPDPEIRGGGGLKKIFRPFGPQFGPKIRGGGSRSSLGYANIGTAV